MMTTETPNLDTLPSQLPHIPKLFTMAAQCIDASDDQPQSSPSPGDISNNNNDPNNCLHPLKPQTPDTTKAFNDSKSSNDESELIDNAKEIQSIKEDDSKFSIDDEKKCLDNDKVVIEEEVSVGEESPYDGFTHVLCCPRCKFLTLSVSVLQQHALGHASPASTVSYSTFTCQICASLSTERTIMLEHIKKYHRNIRNPVRLIEDRHTLSADADSDTAPTNEGSLDNNNSIKQETHFNGTPSLSRCLSTSLLSGSKTEDDDGSRLDGSTSPPALLLERRLTNGMPSLNRSMSCGGRPKSNDCYRDSDNSPIHVQGSRRRKPNNPGRFQTDSTLSVTVGSECTKSALESSSNTPNAVTVSEESRNNSGLKRLSAGPTAVGNKKAKTPRAKKPKVTSSHGVSGSSGPLQSPGTAPFRSFKTSASKTSSHLPLNRHQQQASINVLNCGIPSTVAALQSLSKIEFEETGDQALDMSMKSNQYSNSENLSSSSLQNQHLQQQIQLLQHLYGLQQSAGSDPKGFAKPTDSPSPFSSASQQQQSNNLYSSANIHSGLASVLSSANNGSLLNYFPNENDVFTKVRNLILLSGGGSNLLDANSLAFLNAVSNSNATSPSLGISTPHFPSPHTHSSTSSSLPLSTNASGPPSFYNYPATSPPVATTNAFPTSAANINTSVASRALPSGSSSPGICRMPGIFEDEGNSGMGSDDEAMRGRSLNGQDDDRDMNGEEGEGMACSSENGTLFKKGSKSYRSKALCNLNRPHRQNFTPQQNKMLLEWYQTHRDKPYPSTEDTNMLSKASELSYSQVKKWFANKRARTSMCIKKEPRSSSSPNKSALDNDMFNASFDQSGVDEDELDQVSSPDNSEIFSSTPLFPTPTEEFQGERNSLVIADYV